MLNRREFEGRRQRLFSLLEPNSAVIIFSGVPKALSADEKYPFEVNRNFLYLTGIEQEDSILFLMNADGEMREFLFISPYDPKKEKWYGKRLTHEEAREISGINNVLFNNGSDGYFDSAFNENTRQYGEIETLYLDLTREIKIAESTTTREFSETIKTTYPHLSIKDVFPLLTMLRLRKSSAEIKELKDAIHTTKHGIYAVMSKAKPGVKEYQLSNLFLHTINDESGYQGLSFPTIMASGAHTTCLHYPTPLDTLKDGDLLLMDLGSRNSHYCADISRTIPVNGKFTELQRVIYSIVLEANKLVIRSARPGITIKDLQNLVIDYMAKECLAKGLIKKREDLDLVYFHNVSHFIGLDTHDVPLDKGRHETILEPGMVISNEPGLYFENLGIGVRIEDDLLITDKGCENLSKDIIKEIEDIEKYMGSH